MQDYKETIRYMQETHVACVLLLDTSESMNYPTEEPSIRALNEGIHIFRDQASKDEVAKNTMDVAVVEFNSRVNVISDFVPVSDLKLPWMQASGCTSMGAGLVEAIKLAKKRSRQYQLAGTDAHIPWIVMITDGEPTDNLDEAKRLLREEEGKGNYGHLKLWIIATEGANLKICKELTKRVIYLKDKNYCSIFDWTRKSMVAMSLSKPGDKFKTEPLPSGAQVVPDEWI